MKHVSNEEKAKELGEKYIDNFFSPKEYSIEHCLLDMAQWKDEQLIEQLAAFAVHLQKRGAFRDDLCMDFEHEAQSFLEMQNPKEL